MIRIFPKALAPGLALLLLNLISATAAENQILFHEDFRKPLADRWQQIKFHAPTEYRTVTQGSNACLMAYASGGCSALATKVDIAPQDGLTCSWHWSIDHCPRGASDDNIDTFDHSARVFIAFDTWFLPPRTINYVWANRAKPDSTFDHPTSARTKFIVLQTGNDQAGKWIFEQRDVEKDWNRLFKGEPMPKIVAVGVFTDTHYTGTPVRAWYRDIVLAH
jgi:hypothetical protein